MSQELYNLGRVTGLSAYELNVKHQLSEFPNLPSMTEKEWLASTVTSGASLILKIPAGTSIGPHDYQLPQGSTLCSGNSLLAYPFVGQCEFSNGGWATKVTSYGPLISNTEERHPVTPGGSTDIPLSVNLEHDIDSILETMRDYSKIIDGIIYQAGTWTASGTTPAMTFTPDLNQGSTIRIYFDSNVEHDILILFTGLVNRAVIAGVSEFDSDPVKSPDPQNGDFIGPEVFPWGSKVLFTVPTSILRLYQCSVTDISTDSRYHAYSANIEMDGKKLQSIALEDNKRTKFNITGDAGVVSSDLNEESNGYKYITWQALLEALWSNKSIDVLTDRLRLLRSFLPDLHTESNLYVGGKSDLKGALNVEGQSTVNDIHTKGSSVTDNEEKTKNLTVTDNYITVNNIRLYVSSEQPTGEIPEGSIGIGW